MNISQRPHTVAACSVAFSRWKQRMTGNEMNEHFTVEGEPEDFGTAMNFLAEQVHDAMHEKYGTCNPEGDDAVDFSTEMIRMAFLLGRAVEEQSVIVLSREKQLDL